jgi:hypothetical protein
VKVRGTATHVADKYMTLARDAQAAGDTVSAENYLQHAEHYYRIVMAAQAQFQQTQPQFREGPDEGYDDDRQMNGRVRDRFDYNGDGRGDDSDGYEGGDDRGYRPDRRNDDQDRNRGPRPNRYEGQDRSDRNNNESQDRPGRGERPERADPAAGPQPEVAQAAPSVVAEEAPSQPRRRRTRAPKRSEGEAAGAGESDEDSTKDGAAALAAFPE